MACMRQDTVVPSLDGNGAPAADHGLIYGNGRAKDAAREALVEVSVQQ